MNWKSLQPVLAYGLLAGAVLAGLWLVSLAPLVLGWGRELIAAAIAIVAMAIGVRIAQGRTEKPVAGDSLFPRSESPIAAPRPVVTAPTSSASTMTVAIELSPRETDVLQLLDRGLSNKEMARELKLSENTIKTHLANLYAKLDATRRTGALAAARRAGLLNGSGAPNSSTREANHP
jgi:DNA-binding CsgD family transcriptional regulator